MAEKLELVPDASLAEALAWAAQQKIDITALTDEQLAAHLIEDQMEFGFQDNAEEVLKPLFDEVERRGLTYDHMCKLYQESAAP